MMSIICEQQHQLDKSIYFAKKANKAKPNDMSKLIIARVYRIQGKTDECIIWTNKVLQKNPNDQATLALKAGVMEEAGRVDDAQATLLPLIESVRGDITELSAPIQNIWARVLVQQKQYSQAITLIDHTLSQSIPEQAKIGLLHLKAKACDRDARYDQAWSAAELANAATRLEYDPDLHTRQVDALIEIWSAKNTADFPIAVCDSIVPVFVAGMPRSGTSLIDQIIDAHPKASGVGELSAIESFAIQLSQCYNPGAPIDERFGPMNQPEWQKTADSYIKQILKASPKGTECVVNKALGNNKLVGLIARLFPKTRIIHAIRDPRDVAISCFMGGFNNSIHPWTSRADWTAHTWELSNRMMSHWKETLNIPILDVQYERLVADPENEFPRLIEFLGLDFDPSCYDFHRSKRTVRTLSYDQVNRPLYTTSSGRHKNYEKHLEGIGFPEYPSVNSESL
ncbi:MAG: sulfotransferase [Phycisphaerales bacterium]